MRSKISTRRMETPSSAIAASMTQKKKQEFAGSRAKSERQVLLDISNDSPIVGVATSGPADNTPLSSSAAACGKSRCCSSSGKTPGSGEALLRGQVRTLLQKVEEEAELVNNNKLSSTSFSWERKVVERVSIGFPVSPAQLIAPTPANTPVFMNPDLEDVRSILEDLKKKEEEFLINRALLFDSPGKSESSGGFASGKTRTPEDDSSSGWSLQVNTSIKEEEDEGEEDDNGEEEDEDVEEAHGGGDYEDLCDGLLKMSVKDDNGVLGLLPKSSGIHTRFFYDSDGEMEGEEKVKNGDLEEVAPAASPSVVVLRGLPAPQGKHLRFHNEEEEEDQMLQL